MLTCSHAVPQNPKCIMLDVDDTVLDWLTTRLEKERVLQRILMEKKLCEKKHNKTSKKEKIQHEKPRQWLQCCMLHVPLFLTPSSTSAL